MKFSTIFFTIILISCNNIGKPKVSSLVTKTLKSNSCIIEELESFGDALNEKDFNKIKKKFNFPILDSDIGMLINFVADEDKYDIGNPLHESEIDNYIKEIFPKQFIEPYNDIDFDKLFETKEFSTSYFIRNDTNDNEIERSKLLVKLNTSKKEIVFTLYFEFFEENEKYENSVNYYFNISTCNLKLNKIIFI
jgi:hypothetical protein